MAAFGYSPLHSNGVDEGGLRVGIKTDGEYGGEGVGLGQPNLRCPMIG